jgi:membrane protein required for colicin V production
MPSYLDLTLIVVVLISALLSLLRGFTREVLAIASWAAAAAAAYYFYRLGSPFILPYMPKPQYADYASAAAIFLVTLIVISFVTVRISDAILDSKIGALDRSLGFLFGAGRGYLLCVIGFIFFAWLVPEKSYPDWVKSSKTRSWLEATGNSLQGMLPDDFAGTVSSLVKKPKAGDDSPPETDPDATTPAPPVRPGQRRG